MQGHFLVCTELHEHLSDHVAEPVHASACRAFSQVPALYMASIWGSYDPSHLFFPWSQLTRLALMLEANDCLLVLEKVVNVEECRLHRTHDQLIDFDGTIKLARLRALHIVGWKDSRMNWLSFIDAPTLEIFDVCHYSARNLGDFIESTQTIKVLSLHASVLFARILRLPNLCELGIYKWSEATDLGGCLIYDGSDGVGLLAPHLKTTKISMQKGSPNLRFQDDNLLEMIASRRGIRTGVDITRIQSVNFVDAHLSKQARARLGKMEKGGLQLTFTKSAAAWIWDGEAAELRNFEIFQFT